MTASLPSTAFHERTTPRVRALDRGSSLRWQVNDGLVAVLLVAVLWQSLSAAFRETNFGIEQAPVTGLTIRDFPAHLTFARAFWRDQADYSTASHVRITEQWLGSPVGRALPFGYSPTMLLLLLPLVWLSSVWGYAVWTLGGAAAVWWMTRPRRTVCLAGGLVLLGPLGVICLALGQTALLTSAALVFLMIRQHHREQDGSGSLGDDLLDAVVLWMLTAKPPLALVAGTALLAGRRARTIALALALTLVSTLLLTPKLGVDWVQQYVHLMTHYDRDTADAAFAWSLRPDFMANLRAILDRSGWMGDMVAVRLSSAAWLVAMGAIVTVAWRRRPAAVIVWPLSLLAYLILCPHVTSSEDLHLILILAAIAISQAPISKRMTPCLIGLVLVASLLAPGSPLVTLPVRGVLVLIVKAALVLLVLAAAQCGLLAPRADDRPA